MNTTVAEFDFPDFVPPPTPENFPSYEQQMQWAQEGNPLLDQWTALAEARIEAAKEDYHRARRAAFDAFQAAVEPRRKAKGQTTADAKKQPLRPVAEPSPLNLCPTNLTMCQVTYYDNGESTRTGRFMLAVQAYTADPKAEGFSFQHAQWRSNVLLRNHKETTKSITKLWKAGSITEAYHDAIGSVLALTQSRADTTKIGMFWDKTCGTRFLPDQFVVIDTEHGDVNSGVMYLGADVHPIELRFDRALSNGKRLSGSARAQARYDPTSSRPSWGTC